MEKVNKATIAAKLVEASDDVKSKSEAERIIGALAEVIKSEVAVGNKVDLYGFIEFTPAVQKGRSGTIPGTTKKYSTEDKKIVKIKPLKAFRDQVAK